MVSVEPGRFSYRSDRVSFRWFLVYESQELVVGRGIDKGGDRTHEHLPIPIEQAKSELPKRLHPRKSLWLWPNLSKLELIFSETVRDEPTNCRLFRRRKPGRSHRTRNYYNQTVTTFISSAIITDRLNWPITRQLFSSGWIPFNSCRFHETAGSDPAMRWLISEKFRSGVVVN